MVIVAKKTRFASFFSRLQPYRLWIQTAFLMLWLDPLGIRYHGVCAPVFHCYGCPLATFACPIGVLANFSALHLIPFVTIGLLIVIGALVGSLFCGWACPFGLLQDLAAKIPTPTVRRAGQPYIDERRSRGRGWRFEGRRFGRSRGRGWGFRQRDPHVSVRLGHGLEVGLVQFGQDVELPHLVRNRVRDLRNNRYSGEPSVVMP